jgi:hypothetical protein
VGFITTPNLLSGDECKLRKERRKQRVLKSEQQSIGVDSMRQMLPPKPKNVVEIPQRQEKKTKKSGQQHRTYSAAGPQLTEANEIDEAS